MKYEVNLNIFANTTIEIEAENLEDAKSKAANQLIDMDLNTLTQEVVINFISDENGELWVETLTREWIKFRNILEEQSSILAAMKKETAQMIQKIEQQIEQLKQEKNLTPIKKYVIMIFESCKKTFKYFYC